MNKYQKELIAKCKPYPLGTPFHNLYIIPSGKKYNGFWGKNGFNKIYLVCSVHKPDDDDDEYYLIGQDYDVDVLQFDAILMSCDVPSETNCVRLFCVDRNKRFVINEVLSSIIVEVIE